MALLRRVGSGDRDAFRSLYLVYHKRLSRFLLRFLRSRELIDEVINDTLYAVWCQASGFRGDSQVSTWVFGIGYRKALKAIRRDARAPVPDATAATAAAPTDSDDPDARQRDLRECLERALVTLPAAQRIVIELGYFLGYSVEEIATITASPVNTVKTRMFHARERLRALLPEFRNGELR